MSRPRWIVLFVYYLKLTPVTSSVPSLFPIRSIIIIDLMGKRLGTDEVIGVSLIINHSLTCALKHNLIILST